MVISTSVSRLTAYYIRNGFAATICRAGLAARRVLFSNRTVLFYCDLTAQFATPPDLPSFLKVERKKSAAELSPKDQQAMTSFWNPKVAQRNIKERFDLDASLWLIKSDDELAGYGWTLQGRTVGSHYFPLGQDDVHLFDFHVFPQYRGRRMNPLLVAHILSNLTAECRGRAFIEAAEWNTAQLASLGKTPFRSLGWASKVSILGHTMVWWSEDGDAKLCQSRSFRELPPKAPLRRL